MFFRWEQKLSIDDVCILVGFRMKKFPDVHTHFRNLDFFAACLIIDGLIAYGWTYEELSQCQSGLVMDLSRYIDRQQLAIGRVLRLKEHHPAAVDALIQLSGKRTLPTAQESRKRVCADPSQAGKLSGAKQFYSVTNTQRCFNATIGSNDSSHPTSLSKEGLAAQPTNTVPQANNPTGGPAVPDIDLVGHVLLDSGLAQGCGTDNGAIGDSENGNQSLPSTRHAMNHSALSSTINSSPHINQPVAQNFYPFLEGSLDTGIYEGTFCISTTLPVSVSSDTNSQQAVSQEIFLSEMPEQEDSIDSSRSAQNDVLVYKLMNSWDDVLANELMTPWEVPINALDFGRDSWDGA